MEEKIKLLKAELGDNRIKVDVDITEYLETKLGGKSAVFYMATTTQELIKAVELCQELKIAYLIIGSGSKVAISDSGFSGLIIKNRSDNVKIYGIKGKVSRDGIGVEEAMIEADSGVSLKRLSEFAESQNLGGFEGLKDSIGTVGGSLILNNILLSKCHQVKVLPNNGNLISVSHLQVHKNQVIVSVVFKLKAKKYN